MIIIRASYVIGLVLMVMTFISGESELLIAGAALTASATIGEAIAMGRDKR